MRAAIRIYYRLLQLLLTALMALLMLPVCLQILSRFLSFVPRYIWTEEIARFCFIWIILIGSMIAVRDGSHFAVDLLPHPKTPRGEALARLFVDAMILLVAIIFIVWGWPLVKFGMMQSSEIAELPMVTIYAAWPVAGITWVLFLIENTIDNVRQLRSHSP